LLWITVPTDPVAETLVKAIVRTGATVPTAPVATSPVSAEDWLATTVPTEPVAALPVRATVRLGAVSYTHLTLPTSP
jgi:hypothetical protein